MNKFSMKKSVVLLAALGSLAGVCGTASAVTPMHVVVVEKHNSSGIFGGGNTYLDGRGNHVITKRVVVVDHVATTSSRCYMQRGFHRNIMGHYSQGSYRVCEAR